MRTLDSEYIFFTFKKLIVFKTRANNRFVWRSLTIFANVRFSNRCVPSVHTRTHTHTRYTASEFKWIRYRYEQCVEQHYQFCFPGSKSREARFNNFVSLILFVSKRNRCFMMEYERERERYSNKKKPTTISVVSLSIFMNEFWSPTRRATGSGIYEYTYNNIIVVIRSVLPPESGLAKLRDFVLFRSENCRCTTIVIF